MVAIDLDGTLLNYGNWREKRFNPAILSMLPRAGCSLAIVTNQGGMAFSFDNPDKFPSPLVVAQRILTAKNVLDRAGYPVNYVCCSAFHPKANERHVQNAAQKLREFLELIMGDSNAYTVYTTERARKPSDVMLKRVEATAFYGDGEEDLASALLCKIPFFKVERFL